MNIEKFTIWKLMSEVLVLLFLSSLNLNLSDVHTTFLVICSVHTTQHNSDDFYTTFS